MIRLICVLTFLAAVASPVFAITIHVPGDYPTIKEGALAAGAGDTVIVACGTYIESNIELNSGTYLMSESGTWDCVTIDGDMEGPVISRLWGNIEGFTITGGSGDDGGGIGRMSSVDVTRCRIHHNLAQRGAAVFCYGSSPSFQDCLFESNFCVGDGGAIYAQTSTSTILGCSFIDNFSIGFGGAIRMIESDAVISDCLIARNYSAAGGGLMFQGYGCTSGRFSLSGSTFVGNYSPLGSSLYLEEYSDLDISGCLFAFNEGDETFFLCWLPADYPKGIECCNIYGNSEGDYVRLLKNYLGINGNIGSDPLFCEILVDNYTLAETSPCLPENNDCGLQIGAFGLGCETVTAVPGSGEPMECDWGTLKSLY